MNPEPVIKYIGDLSLGELFSVLELDEVKVDLEILGDAKSGNIDSQFKIAESYFKNRRYPHAKAWCIRLSEKNYDPAQFMLGKLYGDGYLVISEKPGHEEAGKWFEKAYINDPANIPHQVGIYYYDKSALGNKALGNKAFKWFLKGAVNGNDVSQHWVGKFYNRDTYPSGVVVKDKTKAMEWFQKSADQGYQYAIEKVKELKKDGYYLMSKIRGRVTVVRYYYKCIYLEKHSIDFSFFF